MTSAAPSRPGSDDETAPSTPGVVSGTGTATLFNTAAAVSARELELEYSPLEQYNFSTKEAEQLCTDLYRNSTEDFDIEALSMHFELDDAQVEDPVIPVVIRRSLLTRTKQCAVVKRVHARGPPITSAASRYGLFAKIDIPTARFVIQFLGFASVVRVYSVRHKGSSRCE